MKKRWLIYGSFYFLLPAIPVSKAKAQSFSVHQYSTADGLPDNVVYSVNQDSHGYLWIATANGLSRFDGKDFGNYGLPEGLPSLNVNGVYEDHLKKLWVFTRDGLALLKEDSCYRNPLSDDDYRNYVLTMTENAEGELLALTSKYTYVLRNKSWQRIILTKGFENKTLSGIAFCKEGYVMNYEGHTLLLGRKNAAPKILSSFTYNGPFINGLREKNGNCYVSTYKGLFRLENEKLIPLFEDSLKTRYVYSFFVDSKNRFWLSTKEDGILLITPGNDKTTYQKIPVSFNLVYNFFEDKENNIWVSSLDGLLKITDVPYQTYQLPSFPALGQLRNIISLPGNQLLLSGASGKTIQLEPYTLPDQSIHIKIRKVFSLPPGDFIDYYSTDEKNRLWFCTRQSLLYRLDDGVITDYSYLIKNKQGIRSVFYDKPGQKLYVSADSVLYAGNQDKLDTLKETGTGKYISMPAQMSKVPGESLVVNSLNDGLIQIDEKGYFSPVNKRATLPVRFPNPIFRSDLKNRMWVTTEGGGILQYKFDATAVPGKMQLVSKQRGLPAAAVNDFTFDVSGNLWAITKNDIAVLQQNTNGLWERHSFETGDDIKQPDLFFSKIAADARGNVWITGKNKLLRFNPQDSILPKLAPDVVIEKVLLFGKPTNWKNLTDTSSDYFQLPVDPVLEYNNNSLSIFFDGIKFNRDNIVEYSYKLIPADTVWSTPGVNNSISFYQLPAGVYHFSVRARIRGNEWGTQKHFSFTIKKPWWETWWFRILIVLIASGLLFFIFRYRLKQVTKKNEMQSQLRELEIKALKAQMNPHFIHNALNSIQSLIINKRGEEASNYVTKFARLLRQVLENAEKNVITLDKELYSMQLYFDLEQLRLNMEINYEVIIDNSIAAAEIKLPPLILQPFLENALWHGLSLKEGNKQLSLHISQENDWVVCTITDNGIGRQKATESYDAFPEGHLSKAVTITEKRLIDFNHTSQPRPITFTDLYENGIAAGTKAVILIRKQY